MGTKQWMIIGSSLVVGLAVLACPAAAIAQNRSQDDNDRNRTSQSREQSQRDNQSGEDRSQQRNQNQSSRDDSQRRDRDANQSSRDQSSQRDQSSSRDQSSYREDYNSRQESSREDAENEGALGITLMDSRDGVRIRQVLPDSPAQKAGLRAGDLLLTIDEERVRTVQGTEQTIREKEPGDWIDVEVWRNGRRETIEARLSSRQRAIGDRGQQYGSSPSYQGQTFSQAQYSGRQSQFQDGSMQQLAQQLQSLQQQVAQLRQEVSQLRSERQVLRPNFDERDSSGQRNSPSLDGARANERSSSGQRSNDRTTREPSQPDD